MASPVLLLLLLSLLLDSSSSLTPRTSFPLNSADRPLARFSLADVRDLTTLLLSGDGATLYVGARGAFLSLDVNRSDVIDLRTKVQWSPTEEEIRVCQDKGKDPEADCKNFIHVLQLLNSTHLYACGSYAFDPHHAFIDLDSFSVVQRGGAKGYCPYSPTQRSAAVAIDGELFIASATDFFGGRPQISRYFSRDGRPDVTLESTAGLLDEPRFASAWSDPADGKLYFFFTEVGKEFSFVDEPRISRVAQVCKDDVGGERTLQRKWTSFAKAPLLCRRAGRLPFSILQDVFPLPPPEGGHAADTLFHGLFTSQWSSQPESAVCVFTLRDIRNVFSGDYRKLDMSSHRWTQLRDKPSPLGQCGLATSPDAVLMQVKSTFLTSGSVSSARDAVVFPGRRYSRVVALRAAAADGGPHTVLFLLTETGFLHKVVLSGPGPRVLEEVQVSSSPGTAPAMLLSSSRGVVYVGTSEGVAAVPVARCSIYRTCSQCLLARDPLCGWSRTRKSCAGPDGGGEHVLQNLDNGSVEDKCVGEDQTVRTEEIVVGLMDVVTLQCQKPSNLASLNWTSSRYQNLPEDLFLRSAGGGLQFLASANTVGDFNCEAEEDGVRQVVARYHVRQKASPRMYTNRAEPVPDPVLEDAVQTGPSTEGRSSSTRKHPQSGSPTSEPRSRVISAADQNTGSSRTGSGVQDGSILDITSRTNTDSFQETSREKSYYSELVAVSLVLAACVVLVGLGSVHLWRRGRTGSRTSLLVPLETCSKTSTSKEACSLSASADLRVVQ